MEPHKVNLKNKSHSFSELKRQKSERKKRKEEKLLKVIDVRNVNRKCSNKELGNKTPQICTLSIAVPGSILDNAQSPELRTYLAGQIARAACIFKIDEVVVFDDLGSKNIADNSIQENSDNEGKIVRRCCIQLARILQYLECPQYLRKSFFPIHKDLQYAGLLNPLDAPHHLRQNDEFAFREGVTTNLPVRAGKGSAVNCGLLKDVIVDKSLTPGIRVTVKLLQACEGSKKLHGIIVPPSLPSAETGVYWGYTVRIAQSLGEVFSQAPYPEGYDLTIGTSERGDKTDDIPLKGLPYNHALIVFGGLQGLEAALDNDEMLTVNDPALVFDHYLNTCPGQGSRTIRTEEAILISLAELRMKLVPKINSTV
ncbi:putative methyltransferase C9orf114 [Cryptotermes secundus]|uniref:28S rRNA (uridine-N(3))-methyltransferase n=1 Tax=Cryptotermes secundus TaxID=105785 RepID=A0A2J7PDW1_9NEOP|nr:putative methyltransferase C9orf114 [Cryptotermes secundus]PNF14519.1 putative methyltransferase C9orf114 [Cryptotermes secundus]